MHLLSFIKLTGVLSRTCRSSLRVPYAAGHTGRAAKSGHGDYRTKAAQCIKATGLLRMVQTADLVMVHQVISNDINLDDDELIELVESYNWRSNCTGFA